jgi:hypothetical protein
MPAPDVALPAGPTPQRPVAPTSTLTRAARPAGWIIGCLAGVCLLLAIGGGILLAANRLGPAFLRPATGTPPPTQTVQGIAPTPTIPISNTGAVVLEDDFSGDNNWGTLNDADNIIEYDGESFRMQIFRPDWLVWSRPNAQVYQNIHVEVTAMNNDGEPTTAFGILCHQQEAGSSYYYLAVTSAGQYVIAKDTAGEERVFLTNDNPWTTSDQIPRHASSYRVGADCGPGTLTLYVNGRQIASVSDSSYLSGYTGLVAWSGANADAADVTFDDFVITSLE